MKTCRYRLGLLSLGALAAFIYDYAFSHPFNLVYLLGSSTSPDLGIITAYAKHAAAFYVGAVSLLVAGYVASVYVASHITSVSSWRWVLALGVGMALVLVRTYPYAASDLFLYVARGRVLGVYGYSSMELAPVQFAMSAYVPFGSEWVNTASPYGPLWEWVAAFLARLGDGSALRSLLLFKLFNVVCYMGSAWLIYDALRTKKGTNALAGLVAFAWNPLVLLECMANGHNDMLMILFLALAVRCWYQHRHTEFLLALVAGGLTKYVPFLMLPFALVSLYQRVGWRRWLRITCTAGSISFILVCTMFLPLWPGWHLWSLGDQMAQGHNSVFAWLVLTLDRFVDSSLAFGVATGVVRTLFVGGYAYLFVQACRRKAYMIDFWYRVLLLYLVVGASAFGFWYIAWLCALLPFIHEYRQRLWILAFSWTGLISVFIYNFMGTWLAPRYPDLNIHLLAVPTVFMLPLLVSFSMSAMLPPALRPAMHKGGQHLPVAGRIL